MSDPDSRDAEGAEAPQESARDEAGRIKKGHTLNPGGRPKVIAEAKAVLEANVVAGAKKMTSLIHHEDPKVAIAAAKDVIDRVLGKAKEAGEGETRTTLAAFFAGMMSRMSAAEVQAATDEAEDGGGDA